MELFVRRKIYGKSTFKNVIDTEFNQLVPKENIVPTDNLLNIDSFFENYDKLFYSIPKDGNKSHLELLNRSSDYLGINILDLEEEINSLRNENVSLKNQILNLNNSIKINNID